MSLPRGPTRIVLLRAGGYDYAELELHAPVHLVAANNVGKTTLIAALQFLYIDDARQMHFSHEWSETRRHYFPFTGSAILFECMTPTGLQVFGLRGLGPVQGYDYQRFAYTGAYERADYLDGRSMRPWDEVTRRLVGRGLAVLEPKHLRASLTGSGELKGPPLGLVPLKRAGSYESFRFLFRNLLRLSRIDQDQLKRIFIDVTRPRLRQVELDLRRDYAEVFAQVERQAEGVAALRRVAGAVADLVASHEERERLRGRLSFAWSSIEERLEAERQRVSDARTALTTRKSKLEGDRQRTREAQEAVRKRSSAIDKDLGALDVEISRMTTLRERTKSFLPDLEAAIRTSLAAKRDVLIERLAQATRTDRHVAERDLAELRRGIARDAELVERFADAVVTWLRSESRLSDDALGDVFRILNPSLLGAVIATGRVQITDAETVLDAVRTLHGAIDKKGFSGSGVVLPRRVLDPESPLTQYLDVGSVRDRLERDRRRETDLRQTLADIDARDRLADEKSAVEREIGAASDRHRDWESWRKSEPLLADSEQRRSDLMVKAGDEREEADRIQKELTEIEFELRGIAAHENELAAEFQAVLKTVRGLEPCSATWVPAGDDETRSATLGELIATYQRDTTAQKQVSSRVDRLFGDVEQKTSARYVGADEAETIGRLKDELAALENRERAVQELWTSLIDGMRSAFKSLVEGVDEVRREVSLLTQALGRRQISNLERVELELVKQRDLLRKLDAVIAVDDAPLFAGPDGRSRAARDVASWLEERPRIDLSDLFDLRFKVVDRAGRTKSFDSLTQIESQGTSTTIKVLVHLELLKTMLSDDSVAVPFFLDEVATLDANNLRGLIEHACSMGFVPVVASPEPRDCVDTLYFLRPAEQGLVLDETSRVVLRRGVSDGA